MSNKEDEIEDSLRFCKEIQLYYKSGIFENPKNIFEWEKFVPIAKEKSREQHQKESINQEEKLEMVMEFVERMKKSETSKESSDFSGDFSVGISGDGTAVLEPAGQFGFGKEKIKEKGDAKSRAKEKTDSEDAAKEEAGSENLTTGKTEKKAFLKIAGFRVMEVAGCISLAFAISVGVNRFVGTYTLVEGSSMEHTLHDGDYLLIDKLSYHIGEPKRFDIVIFPYNEEIYFIKRIIGMPGETIQIKDGKIYINGKELEESYGAEKMVDGGLASEEFTIGPGEYFVLGDNRNHSTDSRLDSVGTVTEDELVGKASVRIYPFDSLGMLK